MKAISYVTEEIKSWGAEDYLWWLLCVPTLIFMATKLIGSNGVLGIVVLVVRSIMLLLATIGLYLLLAWLYHQIRKTIDK